ncbi:MAG TPA: molecular chaperone HtpG [Spirochaetia bacterium]|nr:molecular chaperone HtpG [Spirochaetales bacterium]HRY80289.1 molecular chaperone HtpG [Spirochaetia bacterium]
MAQKAFQAEVSKLLHLIIHSLYSHKEIFLRELVSNASDALDKLKYLTVSDEAYKAIAFEPGIRVSFDKEAKILTVSDNGIGMDDKDLEENLGTIARSGTRRFLEALAEDVRRTTNLIGRFGVGFYSCFMVSDTVEVLTRKAGQEAAFLWTSDGKEGYEIAPASRDGHGTTITLKLNEEGQEFLSRWRTEEVLKKYSNHVAYPIVLAYEQDTYDDKGKKTGTERKEEQVNAASALWLRPKSELADSDYVEFYRNFADTDEDPLLWMHTKAEGTIEYSTLFYVPAKAPFDLYHADYKPGVKLYVRRVFITDDEKELLPTYLRFVRGVIDSEDLPLNVSREILQQNRVMTNIRNASVKKILGELKTLSESDKEKYEKFADEFNRPLKEGLYSDFANRDALLELVRFKSTSVEGWTSLADYKVRMTGDQKGIYYISGDSEERLRKSPLLEMYRRQGLEVLICADEIDELVVPSIGRYGDLELKAVNRAGAEEDLGPEAKGDEAAEKAEKDLAPAVERIKKALGDRVKDVRLTRRLAESPSCVVVDEADPSLQMQKLMKALGRGEGIDVKPILEINGSHPMVSRLAGTEDEDLVADTAEVLLGQALLVEGASPADPADFVKRMNKLISRQ